MTKYVNVSNERQVLPWAHLDVAPGEECETDRDLSSNRNFARVKSKPEPATPAREA